MKKFIMIAIIAIIVTGAAACVGIGIAKVIHSSSNNAGEFIGNIPGVTDQDIRLCRGSYINGGKYYHQFYDVKLTCTKHHISVDFDHSED